MNKIQRIVQSLSYRQREVYELICRTKRLRAVGPIMKTCGSLFKLGLIKNNPETDNKHDFVLDGPPVTLPKKIKLPKVKNVVEEIKEPKEFKHKPIIWSPGPPKAEYSNTSREQHVEKWLQASVEIETKPYTPVHCLNEQQMVYILANFETKTAKQMADYLKKELYEVKLFCHANVIEPYKPRKNKPYDSYHIIPQSRRQRMNKPGYNAKNRAA